MQLERDREMAIAMDRGRAEIVARMQAGAVTAPDVEALRRAIGVEGACTRDEADAMFALEASGAKKCAEWTSFFVETITEHVVWQARPTGVVNESQGEWLIRAADRARSLNALALLVNVLAEAHRVPLWFHAVVKARAVREWAGVEEARRVYEEEMARVA
jgi:hypothetical protein